MPENMPSHANDNSFLKNIKEGFNEGYQPPSRDIRNQQNLEAGQKLGLTEPMLISQYPQVAQAAERLDREKHKLSNALKWIIAISTTLGASISLLMFKKSQGWAKWAKRGITAIFTGGAAGLIGGLVSNPILEKPALKKYAEFQDIENAVIEQEIATANAHAPASPPPKEFAATVPPRDTNHVAQVTKEALQPNTSAIIV